MPAARPRLLHVTDLAYPAAGRRYCDEDIHLSARLAEDFDVALCHPRQAAALMDSFDAVLVRNSGPVLGHQDAYQDFRERALAAGTLVYNELTGKGDMAGKRYLLDLTAAGHPVIPTVDRPEDLRHLPAADAYVVKPRLGADSVGLRVLAPDELDGVEYGDVLVQPRVDFAYEVSFYFVDHDFQYALYAPDPARRWELVPYTPTPADLEFARRFVEWNAVSHGIQRVDACRARDGRLLLVELEDLNPYLSLDAVPADRRDAFVDALRAALHRLLRSG
ncbi:hypothetical protein [Streptomyces sp. NPDC002644]